MTGTSSYTGAIPQPARNTATSEELLKLLNEIGSKTADDWMLVSPYGNIYIGDI